jgi:phosphatidylserine decarboxylase
MILKRALDSVTQQERINFIVTNRIPRRAVTRFMGWFSRIEHPLVRVPSLALFRLFADDLDLHEARGGRFRSLHDCFTRELRPGARPVDPDPGVLTSPCDAVVGACGRVEGTTLIQAKGSPYSLADLLPDPTLVATHAGGRYVTLRLKASMYHRFHAPHDCQVTRVTYVSGDTWNVNPPALRRIEALYTKNERVVIQTRLAGGHAPVTIVAVAAVLVASVRLRFLDVLLHLKYRGPNIIDCDAPFVKGDEMGWFEHGSTLILFAPLAWELGPGCVEGRTVRMGQPLLRLAGQNAAALSLS